MSHPQPISFSATHIDEQPASIPPSSINNFPSTSEFNQHLPQHHSVASLNYNDEPINHQLGSEIEINQEEQVEELQKVRLQKNEIDQDEILRMFREEENKIENKKQADKKKIKTESHHKDKKPTSNHPSKKQSFSTQDYLSARRREPTDTQTLQLVHKTSSFKDLKSTQSSNPYTTISSSETIKQLLIQFKIQYRASVYDPDWQKERYKLKETFFEQLCIGVEEMRLKSQSQLSKEESEVLEKIREISSSVHPLPYDFGVFKYCRNMVIEIDLEFFMHFHQKSKQPLSKDYKSQYKILLANLKDPENHELRRKILTRQMDADMLKVANQIELFTEAKRSEIRSKEQKLLKEFSVDRDSIMLKPEFENEKEEQRVIESIKYGEDNDFAQQNNKPSATQQPSLQNNQSFEDKMQKSDSMQEQQFSTSNLLAVNKYIDEASLSQLQELLSQNQIQRMRTRLDEDLKGDCRKRMLARFDSLIIGRF